LLKESGFVIIINHDNIVNFSGELAFYFNLALLMGLIVKLSFQYHYHKIGHCIVVRGTALAVIDSKEIYVHEGESTFIPKSTPHRLVNPSKVPLEIIEVQNGEYVGEDDIVRIEDEYKRAE